MKNFLKSDKLNNVCYDIRGPVLELASKMEEEGQKIIKLNIGNVGVFGFDPPEACLLYTSPSPRDRTRSRMPSSA